MTELEQAAVDFFKAILNTSRDILGHAEFKFNIDANIGVKPEDTGKGHMIRDRIQTALETARDITQPKTIEGTTN